MCSSRRIVVPRGTSVACNDAKASRAIGEARSVVPVVLLAYGLFAILMYSGESFEFHRCRDLRLFLTLPT